MNTHPHHAHRSGEKRIGGFPFLCVKAKARLVSVFAESELFSTFILFFF